MKRVVRSAVSVLMTLMLACAVLGSRGAAFTVRAEEINNDPFMSTQEDESVTQDEDMLDVCFYIRGDAIGASIPREPALHLGEVYSDPIRIDNAVSGDFSLSTHEVDGQEADLLSDGFTASNEVSTMLDKLPQAGDIAGVIDGFDESRHYVVWYVIKLSPFSYPYSDVHVHVDGVIRERAEAADSGEEDEPVVTEPTDPVVSEPSESVVTEPSEPVVTEPSESVVTEPTETVATEPQNQDVPLEPSQSTGDVRPLGPSESTDDVRPSGPSQSTDNVRPSGQTQSIGDVGYSQIVQPSINARRTDSIVTEIPEPNITATDASSTVQVETNTQSTQEEVFVAEPTASTAATESEEIISEVTLEVRALFLENGVECREIEYDGSEHIIGGFEIVIHDKDSGNPLIGYLYECYGQFIGFKSYADNGTGTEFTYKGQEFWINVVKAFARVVNPGDSQEVIFYDADDRPLREAADFIIKDSAGNVLPAMFTVVPNTDTVTVRKRDITVEAGTSVRNDSGQTLTDDSFTISEGSLMEGHRIEKVVINGSQTGAGRSLNEISDITIVDENGNDVSDEYNIETVDGQLILVDAIPSASAQPAVSDTAKEIQALKGSSAVIADTTAVQPVVLSTENVVMESADSAGVSTSQSKVLGARRAETGDPGSNVHMRIMLLAACLAAALAMRRFYQDYL